VLVAGRTHALEGLVDLGLEESAAKGGVARQDTTELFLGASVGSGVLPGQGGWLTGRLGVGREFGALRLRVRAEGFTQSVVDGSLRYQFRGAGGALGALYGWSFGRFLLEAGADVGGAFAEQRLANGERWAAPLWSGYAVGAASSRFGPLRVALEVAAGASVLPLNGTWRAVPNLQGALTVGYGL
jgi:hypothetical protein